MVTAEEGSDAPAGPRAHRMIAGIAAAASLRIAVDPTSQPPHRSALRSITGLVVIHFMPALPAARATWRM